MGVAVGAAGVVAVEEAIEEELAEGCICQAGIPGGLLSVFANELEGVIPPPGVLDPAPVPLRPNLEDEEVYGEEEEGG